MASPGPSILVLTGPTAVGKTHVAIELAGALGGELVGADSVQVYRGFDIGASKPTPHELGGIVHHLIDVADPEEAFDAARYAQLADSSIAQIVAAGRRPIIVGGTGLWLRALLRGLVDVPEVDLELRRRLEEQWDARGALAMHARLGQVDPISAARVHVNDKLRVVRALEVFEQTGAALGALREQHALGSPRYRTLTCVIDLPLAHHRERVTTRVRQMIAEGFADEVRALVDKHGDRARALRSVGYAQMVEHVTKGVPLEQTQDEIVRATVVYARRQRTWWKSAVDVHMRSSPAEALSPETVERIRKHFELSPTA